MDTRTKGQRGHDLKLFKDRKSTTVKRNAFSVRSVNDWNSLPSEVISAPSVNAFKARLDRHWKDFQFVYLD